MGSPLPPPVDIPAIPDQPATTPAARLGGQDTVSDDSGSAFDPNLEQGGSLAQVTWLTVARDA